LPKRRCLVEVVQSAEGVFQEDIGGVSKEAWSGAGRSITSWQGWKAVRSRAGRTEARKGAAEMMADAGTPMIKRRSVRDNRASIRMAM